MGGERVAWVASSLWACCILILKIYMSCTIAGAEPNRPIEGVKHHKYQQENQYSLTPRRLPAASLALQDTAVVISASIFCRAVTNIELGFLTENMVLCNIKHIG